MAGKVLNLKDVLTEDRLGCNIAKKYIEWDMGRNEWKARTRELYRYIYATDTTTTSNSKLPWKNSTTTPKLTQIRDNLFANYMMSMFPKRRWLKWEAGSQADASKQKARAIRSYMSYVIEHPSFKETVAKLVLDYLDYGNVFAMPDWLDERVETDTKIQTGYVGPIARRISPTDLVMNPTAPNFTTSPKIIRSLVSLGEVKELLQRLSVNDGEKAAYEELFRYLVDVRQKMASYTGRIAENDQYSVDGFSSFTHYLDSGYVEVLTFYGDIYDEDADEFYKNRIIQVVDRHKVIRNEPNPSDVGTAPIFHSGWRPRQDNLWAMGPLDNLVGLQYRLDHIENLKADFFDLVYAPPLKITGHVEPFEWKPFERIYVGDEGDVEVMGASINPLQANFELQMLEAKMEELAGAPKEAMGFRTPGEKTAYEVQRLENAAARIFRNKIAQFEEQILEPLLNSMLELARRRMDPTTIRVINDEDDVAVFMQLTADDIAGAGRIRPVAARHFAEVAERVQNVTSFYQTLVLQDPMVQTHISSIETARLFEELLELEDYSLVEPFIRITEQSEGEMMAMQSQEDTMMAMTTPAGIAPDDVDEVV